MSVLHHIDLSSGRLEYLWLGPPPAAAPTIVFLHEGLGSAKLWRSFPRALVGACPGWGALVYTRFGYAGSDPIALPRATTYHQPEAVEVLPELLERLGVGEHLLIGHSDGATIALMNGGLAPRPGLRGLIALAPHVFVEEETIAGIARTCSRYQPELRAKLARHHGDKVDAVFRGWADTWLSPEFRDWNVEAVLPGITVPTLVIQGRQDEYATLAQVERVVTGIGQRAEALVIDACGHVPHQEQEQVVLKAMAGFIGRLAAKPAGGGRHEGRSGSS
jgi:pimeloyl-ACP methyl ester carboxylesterase